MSIKVGIDADILPYEIGFGCEKEGTKDWSLVQGAVDHRIQAIYNAIKTKYGVPAELMEVEFWLSDPEGTFRSDLATILPYKGTRKASKPYHWDGIRAYLRDAYSARHMPRLEGDDALAINRDVYDVIASSDKDLRQLPGVYYTWAKGKIPESWDDISPVDAQRRFWSQMLTGDRVDNVLGLFGVGENSTLVKHVSRLVYPPQFVEFVMDEYERRLGRYWDVYFCEHLQLLKLVDSALFINNPEDFAAEWLEKYLGEEFIEWRQSRHAVVEDTHSESQDSIS